jgi:hypothetical protein
LTDRRAALQTARRLDPNANGAQISPTELNVTFIYRHQEGRALQVHWFRRNGHRGPRLLPR